MASNTRPTTAIVQGSKGGAVENSEPNNVVSITPTLNEKALRAAKRSIEDGVEDSSEFFPGLLRRVEAIMNAADPLFETREENRRLVEENARLKLQVAALTKKGGRHG